jgi:thiol-disulfide isomerase/thioredoxin
MPIASVVSCHKKKDISTSDKTPKNLTMKRTNLFTSRIILTLLCTTILFCAKGQKINNQLSIPQIKVGVANISGSVTNLKLPKGEKKVSISFDIYNPVSGEESKYTTSLNENNLFNFDIPLECSTALVSFSVESETINYGNGIIGIDQDKRVQLDIVFDEQGNMKMETKGGLNLSDVDLMNIPKAMYRFEANVTWGDYYKMTPKEFSEYELNVSLKKRISFAVDSLQLSDEIKEHLINSFNLRYLKGRLFYYKEDAEKSHLSAKDSIAYTAVEPDKSYYSFLRDFNLNNPQLLYTYSYNDFMRTLLTIEALKIPPINDTPIDKWLTEVKNSIKDIVGFDEGLFYDMLVANAYTLQMNYKTEPLSIKQIGNITDYYKTKNNEISDILLKNNEEIIKTLERSSDLKINATPSISKEKLMETIISKYKGKVVLVDFWATWCGPCKSGIKDMRSLKVELKNKEIVFVYISNGSSPKDRWESEIKAIGGEQYYIKSSEWNYILDNYGFNGIPSYLIYDKDGELKHKFTGFPGVDKMREMIDLLLK